MRRLLFAAFLLLPCSCNYSGAVYTQYTELSVASVAVRPEEASPVDINMGWDRGSLSYVPKLEDENDTSTGPNGNEAAALIATEKTAIRMLPERSGSVLRAEGAFLSGNAAIIAAQPYRQGNNKWAVVDSGGRVIYEGAVKGTPETRILNAMQAGAFNCPGEEALSREHELVQKRSDSEDVYGRAAEKLPKDFRDWYTADLTRGASKRAAFGSAAERATEGEDPCGEVRMAILRALQDANRE